MSRVFDPFARTVSNGWGDAGPGQPWTVEGGVVGDFSVGSGVGQQSLSAVLSARRSLIGVAIGDSSQAVSVSTAGVTTGTGAQTAMVAARYVDDNNCYLFVLFLQPDQSVAVSVQRRLATVQTDLSGTVIVPGLTHQAGVPVRIRAEAVGTSLRVRAWQAGLPEPSVWHATATDTALTSGRCGVRSILGAGNTNTLPVVMSYDAYELSTFIPIYDPDISRVVIDVDGLAISDSFTRSVSNGWGAADTGEVWTVAGGPTADYSVDGSRGVHSVSAVNSARRTITGAAYDVEITCNVVVGVLATGASIIGGLIARYVDTGNHYAFEMRCEPDQTIELRIQRFAGGAPTPIATIVHPTETHSLSHTSFMVRFQVAGSVLRAKLWHVSVSEPAGWDITVNDPAPLTRPGAIGCRSALTTGNTNTLPVVITYNDFVAKLTPTPVLVERTADNETFSTVRKAGGLLPVAGGAISALDYEFSPDVPNTYRTNARAVSTLPMAGRVTTDGTAGFGVTIDTSGLDVDMAGRMLRLTLTIDKPRGISSLQFFLGVAGFTNQVRWLFNAGKPTHPISRDSEAFTVLLQLAELNSAAGTITISSAGVPSVTSGFTHARLQASDNGTPVTVVLHKVELVPVPVPGAFVSVTFDDSFASTTTLAFPKMQALGFRATDYTIVAHLGQPDRSTLADLQTRAGAGWEIGGHAFNGPVTHGPAGLTAVTAAQARTDLAALYGWLTANFPSAGRHSYAYPIGLWTETSDGHHADRLVREAGFCSGRTTLAGSGSEADNSVSIAAPRPAHPFRLYAMSGISSINSGQYNPTNLIAAGGMLDKVAANGGWLILAFHHIVTGAPASSIEISQTDFNAIMDAIAARGLTVLPVREVLDQLSATVTPTIDGVWLKSTRDPAVNRNVTVAGYSPLRRRGRAGIFDVKGRADPLAVTDVRSSKAFRLDLRTDSVAEADGIDELLDGGETLFLQAPTTGNLSRIPTGYVSVGTSDQDMLPTLVTDIDVISLDCTQVAAPEA